MRSQPLREQEHKALKGHVSGFQFGPGKYVVTYVVYVGWLGTWILYFQRLWPIGFNAFFSCAGPLWAVAQGVFWTLQNQGWQIL